MSLSYKAIDYKMENSSHKLELIFSLPCGKKHSRGETIEKENDQMPS